MACDGQGDEIPAAMERLALNDENVKLPPSKGETRGQRTSGLTHECGVFGCIAAGDWPSPIDVGQVVCMGKLMN